MAVWPTITDRNVEKPNTVTLTATGTTQGYMDIMTTGLNVDVVETPGSVVTEGTPVNAALFAQIKAYIDDVKKDTMLTAHPIGSIYESTDSTEPSVLFGGTWETFGAGRMTVGVDGATYVGAGELGGSATHTNTVEELAPHSHKFDWANGVGLAGNIPLGDTATAINDWVCKPTGNATPYSIMNPYITVYRWRRMS